MFRRRIRLPLEKKFFLSVISGSESGISTTTAIVAGLLTTHSSRQVVLISAMISLAVQAFNSAANHALTTHTDEEIENSEVKDSIAKPLAEAGLQFGTHVIMSLIVLLPIIFINDLQDALLISIATALLLLFLIGLTVGLFVKHTPVRNGIEAMLFGAMIIIIGLAAGYVVEAY